MPIVRSVIRNSSQNVLFSCILFLVSCIAGFFLYLNREIPIQLIYSRDLSSFFLLCCGIPAVIVFTTVFSSFINLAFEAFLRGENSNVLQRLGKHLQSHGYLWFFICVQFLVCLVWHHFIGLRFNWSYSVVIFSVSILSACVIVWDDYDDAELSSSQNMEKSIGACWAYGAYFAFYKIILKNIAKRMSEFEEKHGITLLVKKLVIICPLSCNANGSLESKDGNIKALENPLEEIIEDEGANNNRSLKINVYEIRGPNESYVAAEIPSPLATLYEMRDVLDNTIFEYHRKCFIETLRDLLKSDQCIFLEYDDLNSPEPLHSFLLSKLEDKKFVNVLK